MAVAFAAGPRSGGAAARAARQAQGGLDAAIKKAGTLYKAQKYKPAGEAIAEGQKLLDELLKTDVGQIAGQLGRLHEKLSKAHDLLEVEGVKLPALAELPAAAPKGAKPAAAKTGTVSFTKQVAPLLAGKCGGCHVRAQRGLQHGELRHAHERSQGRRRHFSGKQKGSRIVEVIESGDMPPSGGGKVAAAELAMLAKWIDEGARFDGTDQMGPLAGARAKPEPDKPKLQVVAASGKDEVQFARDIGPVLVANCTGCHGANPAGSWE